MFKIAICRGSAGYLVLNAIALTKPTSLLDFLRSIPNACIVEPPIAFPITLHPTEIGNTFHWWIKLPAYHANLLRARFNLLLSILFLRILPVAFILITYTVFFRT